MRIEEVSRSLQERSRARRVPPGFLLGGRQRIVMIATETLVGGAGLTGQPMLRKFGEKESMVVESLQVRPRYIRAIHVPQKTQDRYHDVFPEFSL
jgi:hypothetical protein